jgi:hypothetical protein
MEMTTKTVEKRFDSPPELRSGSTKFSSTKLIKQNEENMAKNLSKFEKSKNVRFKISSLLTLDTLIIKKFEFVS